MISLKHLTCSHTAINLRSELYEIIDDYDLRSKMVTISADGAPNINNAITDAADFDYINCIAHLLNLVVKDLFKVRIFDLILTLSFETPTPKIEYFKFDILNLKGERNFQTFRKNEKTSRNFQA